MVREYKFILAEDGKTPISEPDVLKWAQWMEDSMVNNKRQVARTEVGEIIVSTVFLGIDQRMGQGDPILWETMMFDENGKGLNQIRATSYEEALEDHKHCVKALETLKLQKENTIIGTALNSVQKGEIVYVELNEQGKVLFGLGLLKKKRKK